MHIHLNFNVLPIIPNDRVNELGENPPSSVTERAPLSSNLGPALYPHNMAPPVHNFAEIINQSLRDRASSLLVQPLIMVEGGFQNLTNIVVPLDVATLLSYGVKFVPPSCPTLGDYISTLYTINNLSLGLHKDPCVFLRGYLRRTYDSLLKANHTVQTSYDMRLSLMVKKAISFLSTHSSACLVQSDKGKSIVLITKEDYHKKMSTLVDKCLNRGVYLEVQCPQVAKQLKDDWHSCYKALSLKLIKEWAVSKRNNLPLPFDIKLKKLLPTFNNIESPLPYLYGSLKTHKPDVPCRPICSTRTWCCFPLQKIICQVLTNATKTLLSDFNVRNTDEAAHRLRSTIVFRDFEFIKLDIEDMYTNMDRVEILNMVRHLVSTEHYIEGKYLDGQLLMECLELCLGDNTLFTYNGRTFRQLQGLPQGACDSGLLATMLLDLTLQIHHFDIFINNRVVWCMKYVDDLCFFVHKDYKECLRQLISYVTQLSYTIEEEESSDTPFIDNQRVLGQISFLDINVYRCDRNVYVRTYTKPMVSQRMCHYLSRCDVIWKESTIDYYVRRVLLRSSNPFLVAELHLLERKFSDNMCPRIMYSNSIIKNITLHIKACRQAFLLIRTTHNFHPICSLGNLFQRCKILVSYIETLGPLPEIYFRDLQAQYNTFLGNVLYFILITI